MTVSRTPTFEQTPPRRPAWSDILSGSKTNATSSVPPNIPAAEEYEQMANLHVAQGRMAPLARISVTGGSTPVVTSLMTVRGDVVGADIVINRVSAGIVEVTLPAGLYPSAAARPMATLNGTHPEYGICAESMTNGARVRTCDGSGTATDLDFTLELF